MMGRPPIFETPEELETKIEEYFHECEGKIEQRVDEDRQPYEIRTGGNPITITGLALYLGFESRQSFYDYEKKEDFSYIIRRARLTVECAYEKNLQTKYCTGSVFALKNMGWKDSQEIKHELQRGIMNLDALADDTAHDSPQKDSQT